MKRASWMHAVQAPSKPDGNSNLKNLDDEKSLLQKADALYIKVHTGLPAPDRRPTVAIPEKALILSNSGQPSPLQGITSAWVDDVRPPAYSQINVSIMPSDSPTEESGNGNLIPFPVMEVPDSPATMSPTSSDSETSPTTTASSTFDSPTISGKSKRPNMSRRTESYSSISTIFEGCPSAPVTIIVTTPDDEIPSATPFHRHRGVSSLSEFPQGDFYPTLPSMRGLRNGSTTSLPTVGIARHSFSGPHTIPDRNRLMLPIDSQLTARKLKKAQEFWEVRVFLIRFLNMKGEEIPPQLRSRMMEIYGIREVDLDPVTIVNFARAKKANLQVMDEGVSLDGIMGGFGGPSNADHMKILETAFQSIIPVVTPKTMPPQSKASGSKRKSLPTPAAKTALIRSTPPNLDGKNRKRASLPPTPIKRSLIYNSQTSVEMMKDKESKKDKRKSMPLTSGAFRRAPVPKAILPPQSSSQLPTVKKSSSSTLTKRSSTPKAILPAPTTAKTAQKTPSRPLISHSSTTPQPLCQPKVQPKPSLPPAKAIASEKPIAIPSEESQAPVPPWLAPLSSVSSKSTPLSPRSQAITQGKELKHSRSTHTIAPERICEEGELPWKEYQFPRHPAVSPLTSTNKKGATGGNGRQYGNWLTLDEDQRSLVQRQLKIKREGIIRGAFGAVRDAMGLERRGSLASR